MLPLTMATQCRSSSIINSPKDSNRAPAFVSSHAYYGFVPRVIQPMRDSVIVQNHQYHSPAKHPRPLSDLGMEVDEFVHPQLTNGVVVDNCQDTGNFIHYARNQQHVQANERLLERVPCVQAEQHHQGFYNAASRKRNIVDGYTTVEGEFESSAPRSKRFKEGSTDRPNGVAKVQASFLYMKHETPSNIDSKSVLGDNLQNQGCKTPYYSPKKPNSRNYDWEDMLLLTHGCISYHQHYRSWQSQNIDLEEAEF